jgi:segregation and condensation protein A
LETNKSTTPPNYITEKFEGPLDLLCYLIEKDKINIYDIPITNITDQFINYISTMPDYDMESVSAFLVMASTLIHIKSKILLPSLRSNESEAVFDPREELVLRILEYRRCKTIAANLSTQHETYRDCVYRFPESLKDLGIQPAAHPAEFSVDMFYTACKILAERNKLRFSDTLGKITQILKREKISLKEKMKTILNRISERACVFFNEIFPECQTTKAERVVGFLAMLELLRINKIKAKQKRAFDQILIEPPK